MVMTKKQFEEIKDKYQTRLMLCEDDWVECLKFVQDLLNTEAKTIEVQEPYATETIGRLLQAETEVFNLQNEIEDEDFGEEE